MSWTQCSAPVLEEHLECKLEHARVAGRGDRAERGAAEGSVGRTERRRVGDVEGLDAHLEEWLPQRDPAAERHVEIAVAWAPYGIARRRSQRELRRSGEGAGVEPARHGLLIRGERRVAGQVRTLRAVSSKGVRVGRLCNGDR